MAKNNDFGQCRVRRDDIRRIDAYIEKIRKTLRVGRIAQPDVITLALDALDEKEDIKIIEPLPVDAR